MEDEPALELALLERVEAIGRSVGEEIIGCDEKPTFDAMRQMMQDGLIEGRSSAEGPGKVESLLLVGLTEEGRRRLRALREAGLRPW